MELTTKFVDNAKLQDHPIFHQIISASGTKGGESILYSGFIEKLNRIGRFQRRLLAVTSKSIFLLECNLRRCSQKIELKDLGSIIRSPRINQLIFIVPEGTDRLFITEDEILICEIISDAYKKAVGTDLKLEIMDKKYSFEWWHNMKEEKRQMEKAAGKQNSRVSPTLILVEDKLKSQIESLSIQENSPKAEIQTVTEGDVELSSFVILRLLGKGSFGEVYLVRMRQNGQVFAMKTLSKEVVIQRKQLEHTLTERHVLQSVQHPYLVKLHWSFQTESRLYFIMDYLNGGELFFHLKREGRFSERRARFYASEIVLAIGHLHSLGIVYRDLKPENILLDSQGHLRITDFGLAKQAIVDNSSASTFCGTPEYLAPEVLQGKGHGRAVDWWSLGTLLHEMLSGLPPFYDKNTNVMYQRILHEPLQISAIITGSARDLLKKMLERNPEKRLGASLRDAEEVKEHEFFKGMDWEALQNGQIQPPFVPIVKNAEDTANFDVSFTKQPVKCPEPPESSEKSNIDSVKLEYMDASLFDGFCYSPTRVSAERETSFNSNMNSNSRSKSVAPLVNSPTFSA